MNVPEQSAQVHGLHHVTAIAGDPQENLDFYTGVMGLRLVKKSINQDAPDTYHFFFADAAGTPGTDLTFFPWPDMQDGRRGVGQVAEVPFAIPAGSAAYWRDRLEEHDVEVGETETRFGESALPFRDPHGLHLSLVEIAEDREFVPWAKSPVPEKYQLRGMHAVRIWQRELEPTELVLTTVMGFEKIVSDGNWHRYGVHGGQSGKLVDVQVRPDGHQGRWGHGAVHHVAFTVRDDEEENAVRRKVDQVGLGPTPPIDRFWFKSVYFREPGGTLFELATEGPGFTRDEDADELGSSLILPPWMEEDREHIESNLPDVTVSVK